MGKAKTIDFETVKSDPLSVTTVHDVVVLGTLVYGGYFAPRDRDFGTPPSGLFDASIS